MAPAIRQVGFHDVLDAICDPRSFDRNLLDHLDSPVLIAAGGFEERASRFCTYATATEWHQVITIRYPWNLAENAPCMQRLQELTAKRPHAEIGYDRLHLATELQDAIRAAGRSGARHCIADLSGMSSVVIHATLAGLFEAAADAQLEASIYFCDVAEHRPTKSEWVQLKKSLAGKGITEIRKEVDTKGILSVGSGEVFSSAIYTGGKGDDPTLLVLLPGFEFSRIAEVITHAERQYGARRDEHIWILPSGGHPDQAWRLEALHHLYAELGAATQAELHADAVREVFGFLATLCEKHEMQRSLVIAPLGTKMHHVGVAFFLRAFPSSELLHCEPSEFRPGQYTRGIGNEWWLPVGHVRELDRQLRSVGRLEFNWA